MASPAEDPLYGRGEDDAGLVSRMRALQPLVQSNAANGELDRRITDESITALAQVGAFKALQPQRYGGYETSIRNLLDVSAAIAEADGGTAWIVTIGNVCAWMTALFCEQAQDDVWGANPDARVCSVLAPTAEATKVSGGYRVTGRWSYTTGAWHSQWAILGIPVPNGDGDVIDHGLVLIPGEDLHFDETWFVAGMKSTGSNRVTAERVFVPEHRLLSVTAATEGIYPHGHRGCALYRSAFNPLLALALAGPQLGMGRKALQIVRESAEKKAISYTYYRAQSDSAAFQIQLSRSAMMIHTAHLLAYQAADSLDEEAVADTYPGALERARVRAVTSAVIENITQAIDLLLYAHGAGAFADANPLQRIWRDSAIAARHAITLPAVNHEVYGKALLGRDDQITPLI
jgi:alkylation response protein AidB-like acyl-CoA dehydrogenase